MAKVNSSAGVWTQALRPSRASGYVKSGAPGTAEWTNPDGGDPGAADSTSPDLQEIVVLCATGKPGSKALRKEWRRWLPENYRQGMDVDTTIADVLCRAEEHRRRNGHSPRGKKRKNKIEQNIHEVTKAIIQDMKAWRHFVGRPPYFRRTLVPNRCPSKLS